MILKNVLVLVILTFTPALSVLTFRVGPGGLHPILRICPSSMYVCGNGRCIRPSWVCDLQDDCGDNSDEKNCDTPRSCTSAEFRCNDGRCIPRWWMCDGDSDCASGEDEDSCEEIGCPPQTFLCNPGTCIPEAWVCDGGKDCINGKDEANCTVKCQPDEFKCESNHCIMESFVCDGDSDCTDGSDEKNCPAKKCSEHQFLCSDNSACISKSWVCDRAFDCRDKSDELNCETKYSTALPHCKKDEFQCSNPTNCIPSSWVCNGVPECLDRSDESLENCKNITCRADEFQCKNRTCLPGYLQCNGVYDCSDGSDEEDCGTPRPSCNGDEFNCGGGICIPLNKTCDKKKDCPLGEDEPNGKCNLNECQDNNGGCSQLCVDTPTSFHCECRPGFKLIDNFTCDDVNECDNPSSCSQKCVNEKGTFKCECLKGYQKDPADHKRCKAVVGDTKLIFTRRRDIRMLNLAKKEMRIIINQTTSSIALDFVYKSSEIFWSDGTEQKIFKSNIFNSSEIIPVIESDLTVCDGLAVDWIYHHIYWSDTEKDTIRVANFNGTMKKTLISSFLDKPRAVVLDPLDGWMFWSDWGSSPRIERSGLDGSHRSTIISYDVQWPNGLALDLVKKRIYWIDAKLDILFSANYDGGVRKIVLRASEKLVHPFSIALFEDSIYWTDWSNRAIYKADKFDGSNATALTEEGTVSSPMVVHVFHPYKQPDGVNYCLTSKCSHFCFPAPHINERSPKISCGCPDGLNLSSDGMKCGDDDKMPQKATTVSPKIIDKLSTAEFEVSTNASQTTKIPQTVTNEATTPSSTSETTMNAHMAENEISGSAMRTSDEEDGGYVGIIVASTLSVLILIALSLVIMYYVHQRYFRQNMGSIQFVNPVYRRHSGDYVSLDKNEQQSSSTSNLGTH